MFCAKKVRIDENDVVPPSVTAKSKRLVLGDLQNRVLRSNATNKEDAQKDSKDVKGKSAAYNIRSRVDSYWKIGPQSGTVETNTKVDTAKPSAKAASIAKYLTMRKPKKVKQLKEVNTNQVVKPAVCKSVKLFSTIENIDADDKENLVLVSEYVKDIYDYLYTVEVEHAIRPNHLDDQKDVTSGMRAILMDWLNEVHQQFHLTAETYQITVAIVDRYLQAVNNTERHNFQLIGVTALFIAAKYEELFSPSIENFVYITDDTYDTAQILQMERKVLIVLDYNLSRPLPIQFLRRYSKAANAGESLHTMSKYFIELILIEYDLAAYKPSEIAAASLFLALHLLKEKYKSPTGFNDALWTPTLAWYSRYSATHLRPITRKIANIARHAFDAHLKVVFNKYQLPKYKKISLRPELYGELMDSIVNANE